MELEDKSLAGKFTTCNIALQKFEEKTGKSASQCEEISLISQVPPLTKLDGSLKKLSNCRKLSLSTNSIDKIIGLPNLKNLQILSIGRNQIRKLQGLEEVASTLKELWISYNLIEKLDGIACCQSLEVLYISNNKIKSTEEIEKLSVLKTLKNVSLRGNPIYDIISIDDMKTLLFKNVPKIKILDGEMVVAQEFV